jgi:hypothetical protein
MSFPPTSKRAKALALADKATTTVRNSDSIVQTATQQQQQRGLL